MQPYPRFLFSAANGWRSVALTTLAAAIVLALLSAITLGFGPGTRLAWELVPAYTQVQQTKAFLPLLTFDASFTDAFTMPYCGWPPLYGLLLLPFAWLGVPFTLASVLLNSLLALLAGWLAAGIARSAGRPNAIPTVFVAAALSTGIGANLTMAFPHILIPIPLLLTALVFLKVGTNENRLPVAGLVGAGAALGFVCGLSNWASYANIALPALVIVSVFLPVPWRAAFNTRNCLVTGLAMGVAMCICFVLLLAFKEWAYGQSSALPFRTAMDTDKFLARVKGSPVDYAKGAFYTLIRAGVVVIPVAVGLAVSIACGACRLHRPSSRSLLFAAAFVLPALSYALVFVGESNHAAHAFYSILWVGPSLALFTFASIIRPQRAALIFGTTVVAANLLLLLGWKVVPPATMYVGGIPVSDLTLRAPVSKPQETTSSSGSSNALVRSFLKQSLYFPYDFMDAQSRVRSMQALGKEIQHEASHSDAILMFGENQIQWNLARFAERTVVGISSANATGVAAFFEQQEEPLDVMVVVPLGAAAEARDTFDRAFERTRFHIREVDVFQKALPKR
jgi:hypothetical protein